MSQDDEDYHLPLQDQRVFGAGIKRKRVPFVRAQSQPPTPPPSQTRLQKQTLGDRYLAIVLPQGLDKGSDIPERAVNAEQDGRPSDEEEEEAVCAVCRLPITTETSTALASRAHEASLAHQVCLTHSDPPSHLDRAHVGLRYLSSYGWDPDGRRGLGARGTGIRVPVKGKVKNDTVGLGVKDVDRGRVQKEARQKIPMSAKQVRKQEAVEKERDRRLREAFYGRDLEAYLGPGG